MKLSFNKSTFVFLDWLLHAQLRVIKRIVWIDIFKLLRNLPLNDDIIPVLFSSIRFFFTDNKHIYRWISDSTTGQISQMLKFNNSWTTFNLMKCGVSAQATIVLKTSILIKRVGSCIAFWNNHQRLKYPYINIKLPLSYHAGSPSRHVTNAIWKPDQAWHALKVRINCRLNGFIMFAVKISSTLLATNMPHFVAFRRNSQNVFI